MLLSYIIIHIHIVKAFSFDIQLESVYKYDFKNTVRIDGNWPFETILGICVILISFFFVYNCSFFTPYFLLHNILFFRVINENTM